MDFLLFFHVGTGDSGDYTEEYYVVTNADKLKELAQTSPYAGCTANAPMAFVACYRKECRMPEYAPIDLSASVENLLLEADELGLGAVWLGIAPLRDRMDKVREVISIPESPVPTWKNGYFPVEYSIKCEASTFHQ